MRFRDPQGQGRDPPSAVLFTESVFWRPPTYAGVDSPLAQRKVRNWAYAKKIPEIQALADIQK
jgi:hypothetical protein